MTPLPPPDQRHLEAAEGWLGLGDHLAANEELDSITPRLRAHPDPLKPRFEVCWLMSGAEGNGQAPPSATGKSYQLANW